MSTSPFPYSIQTSVTRQEMVDFVAACWEGWHTPYNFSTRIGMRVYGHTKDEITRSIAEVTERIWTEYSKAGPEKKYLFARHDPTGKMVGGLRMDFAEKSPWPNGIPNVDIWWWPEGEEVREFCNEMYRQIFTQRAMWMQRPHGGMQNYFVHPDHRGKGVGQLLLDYNARELDARGLEGFVEATERGRVAYERGGYQVVMKLHTYIPAGKSNDWKRWHHEMGPAPWFAMWRPKNGRIEPGERQKPWQLGPSIPI